jgi:hypothetical protein
MNAYADLSPYTREQLATMHESIETELLAYMRGEGPVQTPERDAKGMEALELLERLGPEIRRRDAQPSPGPCAVHYEVMPDGSAPIRLSCTVLCF